MVSALPLLATLVTRVSSFKFTEPKYESEEVGTWVDQLLSVEGDGLLSGIMLSMNVNEDLFPNLMTGTVDDEGRVSSMTDHYVPGLKERMYVNHNEWSMKWLNRRAVFRNIDPRLHGLFGQNYFEAPPVTRIPKTSDEKDDIINDVEFWKKQPLEYSAELGYAVLDEYPDLAYETALRCIYGHDYMASIALDEFPLPRTDVHAADIRCYSLMGDLIFTGLPKGKDPALDRADWLTGLLWWAYGSLRGDADAMFNMASFLDQGFESLVRFLPLTEDLWNEESAMDFITILRKRHMSPDQVRSLLLNGIDDLLEWTDSDATPVPMIYFGVAAIKGHVGANLVLGDRYARGIAVPRDCQAAADYYIEGANQANLAHLNGFPAGREGSWDVYDPRKRGARERGILTFKDQEFLATMLEDKDDIAIASLLSARYLLGSHGYEQSFAKTIDLLVWIIKEAEDKLDNPGSVSRQELTQYLGRAYGLLGYLELYGVTGHTLVENAAAYFSTSWNVYHHPIGAIGLGILYHYELVEGTPYMPESILSPDSDQEKSNAEKLFQIASDAGYQDGQFSLALLNLENGNHAEAIELLAKAIESGHTTSAYVMGVLHIRGVSVNHDCQLGVKLLAGTAKRQQWVLNLQSRATRVWQRLQQKKHDGGSFAKWTTTLSSKDRMLHEHPQGYETLLGLHASRLGSVGIDDALHAMAEWTLNGTLDVISSSRISNMTERKLAQVRMATLLLENIGRRDSSVYFKLGELYHSGFAPIPTVITTPMTSVDPDGESLSGWLTEGIPMVVDRPIEFVQERTPSVTELLRTLINISSEWKMTESDRKTDEVAYSSMKANTTPPLGMNEHNWWDFIVARAHFRSSRDAPYSSPNDQSKASFTMAMMALMGQGGPVDYQLATTHLRNMTIYSKSCRRSETFLLSFVFPLINKLGKFHLPLRKYAERLLYITVVLNIHIIFKYFRSASENPNTDDDKGDVDPPAGSPSDARNQATTEDASDHSNANADPGSDSTINVDAT